MMPTAQQASIKIRAIPARNFSIPIPSPIVEFRHKLNSTGGGRQNFFNCQRLRKRLKNVTAKEWPDHQQ